jgi:DNA-binding MarR family transcriptional regulator
MTTLSDYGGLLLGARLRRVSDALYAGVDAIYQAHGVELPSRCFPILFLLRDDGPSGITELATKLGQTHPAVVQMSAKLAEHGVVTERADRKDERRRLLVLSPKGKALMARLEPIWQAIVAAVDELAGPKGTFLTELTAVDAALAARDFEARIRDQLRRGEEREVEIIPYARRYRADFKRLNLEWLERFFEVEPIDEEVLSSPERFILKPGGALFLARHKSGEIVGTCALLRSGGDRYELTKMAVTERLRGLHIGSRLLRAAIDEARRRGARELFLESSTRLGPALRLYEANGFRHTPRPRGPGHYARSDVYMVYRRRLDPRA